jgi:hypothetical protein
MPLRAPKRRHRSSACELPTTSVTAVTNRHPHWYHHLHPPDHGWHDRRQSSGREGLQSDNVKPNCWETVSRDGFHYLLLLHHVSVSPDIAPNVPTCLIATRAVLATANCATGNIANDGMPTNSATSNAIVGATGRLCGRLWTISMELYHEIETSSKVVQMVG